MKSFEEIAYGSEGLIGKVKGVVKGLKTAKDVAGVVHSVHQSLKSGEIQKGLDTVSKVVDIVHHVTGAGEKKIIPVVKKVGMSTAQKTALGVGATALVGGGAYVAGQRMMNTRDDSFLE